MVRKLKIQKNIPYFLFKLIKEFMRVYCRGIYFKILDESWMSQIDDKICQKDGINGIIVYIEVTNKQ